jgi:hypothetical protein
VVALVAACSKDATFQEPLPPAAAITWLNAISDTGQVDIRVIDIPTNAGFFDADFRALKMFPERLQAGARHIRVFTSGTNINAASTILLDTTFTFVADERYAFYVHGFRRTGSTPAAEALITTASAPAKAPDSVHVRVINLAPTLAPEATTPLDAWIVARGPAALAGAPTIPAGTSTYAKVAAGPYRMAFTAAGTTSPILFQSNMPAGVIDTLGNIGGTSVAGTALTAVVVPRSVPGSQAPLSFAAVLPFTSITTTGTTLADTIATAVTPAPHGLTTADTIIINGAVDTTTGITGGYNGTFRIATVVDANTFRYRISTSRVRAATATGHPFWLLLRNGPSFNGRPISSLTAVGTTATVFTPASHGLANNDIVTISGATDPAYNGSFAITLVGTGGRTFTYTTNGTPAASPATGAPVFRVGDADYTRPNVVFLIDRRP